MRAPRIVAAFAIFAGCAGPGYLYRPTQKSAREDAPATVEGHPAASYPIANGNARGEVTLAALGTRKMQIPNGERTVHTVLVRMLASNTGHDIWSIDARALDGVIDGVRHEYPLRTFCDGQEMSFAVLMPGETRTIDLYYPVGKRPKGKTPTIAVDWKVRTPSGMIARANTDFEGHRRPPPPLPPPDAKQMVKSLDQSARPRPTEQLASPETRGAADVLR